MDAAGRLVIPKKIRHEAGIQPGVPLEVRVRDGRIEIEPEPMKVRFVREGRLLVAYPLEDTPPMDAEIVDATLEAVRDERSSIR